MTVTVLAAGAARVHAPQILLHEKEGGTETLEMSEALFAKRSTCPHDTEQSALEKHCVDTKLATLYAICPS